MSERLSGMRAKRGPAIVLLGLAAMGAAVIVVGGANATATKAHQAVSPKLTLAKARADVAAARRPMKTFAGPTVSPGPVPSGKSIVSIFSVPAPLPQRSARGVGDAAKAIGWKAQVVNGVNPTGWLAAINTAVTGGADGIVFNAGVGPLIAPGVAKAKAAGVPFVEVFSGATNTPPAPGTFQSVNTDEFTEGYRLAEWVVQSAPAGASILAYDSPEFPALKGAAAGFRAGVRDAGAKYKIVENVLSPVSDVTSAAGAQRIAALLRKHPDAKYFFLMSESWAGVFQQAIESTGRKDVTGLGTDGDFFLPQIKKGANFVEIGPDTREMGYFAMDAMIRAFNGKPPVKYKIPFQILDRSNAKGTQGTAIANAYDFRSAWLKFWGVKK